MSLSDFLTLLKPLGTLGIVIALLLAAVVVLYRQQVKSAQDALAEANARADRLEAELKAANTDFLRYLALNTAVKNTLNEAVDTLKASQ